MAHYEITYRKGYVSVRLYDEDPDKYVSCFQSEIDGKKAYTHSLSGAGFYRIFKKLCRDIFTVLNIEFMEFEITEDHLKAMERLLGDVITIEDLGQIKAYGRIMRLVKAKLKD